MEKKIEDYIHFYLGQKVEYDGRIGVIVQYFYPGQKSYTMPLEKVWVCSLEEHGNEEMSCQADASKVKPILRPLSDMTEEELQELLSTDKRLIHRCESVRDFIPGWMAYPPTTFKWLLSKGFDLFGLIDAGLAINKLNQLENK